MAGSTEPLNSLRAISLLGTNACKVSCNAIWGDPNNPNPNSGIYVFESAFSEINCNDIRDVHTGIEFSGDCPDTDLWGNDMWNMEIELYMTASAMFGDNAAEGVQAHKGNRWMGDYNDALGAARHEGPFEIIQLSSFIVDFGGDNLLPSSIFTPNATNANWFINQLGTALVCTPSPLPNLPVKIITKLDKEIAKGTVSTESYQQELKWAMEKELYTKLDQNPELIETDLDISAFYAAKTNNNSIIKQYRAVELEMEAGFTLALQEQQSLENTDAALTTLLEDLYDVQDGNGGGMPSQQKLLAAKLATETAINNQAATFLEEAATTEAIESSKTLYIDEAGLLNSNIYTDFPYKQASQNIYEIYLNTVARGIGSFSSDQLATIQMYANSCPLARGDIVFKARSLWAMIDPVAVYNDDALCDLVGINRSSRKETKSESNNLFTIYPNPANDFITLAFNAEVIESRLYIYALSGQLI